MAQRQIRGGLSARHEQQRLAAFAGIEGEIQSRRVVEIRLWNPSGAIQGIDKNGKKLVPPMPHTYFKDLTFRVGRDVARERNSLVWIVLWVEAAQLKLRVDPKLRQLLEKFARKHGVSINREVEQRLSRSCVDDELIEEQPAFQHPAMRGMMTLVATAMLHAGQAKATAFASWLDDPVACGQAVEAAKAVLDAVRPPGAVEMNERQKTFSQLIAEWTLESVANPSNQRLREDLGPVLLERIVQSAKSHSSERVEPTMQPSEAEMKNQARALRERLNAEHFEERLNQALARRGISPEEMQSIEAELKNLKEAFADPEHPSEAEVKNLIERGKELFADPKPSEAELKYLIEWGKRNVVTGEGATILRAYGYKSRARGRHGPLMDAQRERINPEQSATSHSSERVKPAMQPSEARAKQGKGK